MKRNWIMGALVATSCGSLSLASEIDLLGSDFSVNGTKTQGKYEFSSQDLLALTPDVWQMGYTGGNVSNQVAVTTGNESAALVLQIGAVCPQNQGHAAAVAFDTTAGEKPLTLSFDYTFGSAWGNNVTQFSARYDVTVYGIDGDTVTQIGDWSLTLGTELFADGSSSTLPSGSASIDLSGSDTVFSKYAVEFKSVDTSTQDSAAGCSYTFDNILVATTPEPTTATLSLLALAGLCARRRRKA